MEAVNVCSGAPASILDVASGLSDAFGPGAPRPVVTGEYRLGDVRHVVASPGRAAEMIGFRSRVSLGEGLASLAEWTRSGASGSRGSGSSVSRRVAVRQP